MSARHIDFGFSRRRTLNALQRGALAQHDVCDAHPELIRAARHAGASLRRTCPICDSKKLCVVRYVYGDRLRSANGKCIESDEQLDKLRRTHDEFDCYVVEVCPDCRWNHLLRRALVGRRHKAQLPLQGR